MNIYWTTNAKEFGGGKVQNVPYKYRLLGYVDGHLTLAFRIFWMWPAEGGCFTLAKRIPECFSATIEL